MRMAEGRVVDRPLMYYVLLPKQHGTALTCSGGYHLERGGMPLHDAVGINCEKDATEYQGADVKYMG